MRIRAQGIRLPETEIKAEAMVSKRAYVYDTLDSSSSVCDQQSVNLSPGLDTCVLLNLYL